MKNIAYFVSAAAVGLFCSCGSGEKKNDNNADSLGLQSDTTLTKSENAAKLDTTDVNFFANAAYGGLVEVESSKKIIQLTTDTAVKRLAEMIVKDHDSANVALKALAESKGYIVPKALPEKKSIDIQKMETFKNEGRDEYYVRLMLKEHQNAIDLFAGATRSKDKEISNFALKVLPTLKAHHHHATKVDSAILAPKANQGDDPLKLSDRKKQ